MGEGYTKQGKELKTNTGGKGAIIFGAISAKKTLVWDEVNGNWGGELLWTVVANKDKVSSDTVTDSEGYAILDLVGDLRIGDAVSLRAGVFNIFDEEYAIWQSIQGLDKVQSADTILNNYQPGTNRRVGLNIEF